MKVFLIYPRFNEKISERPPLGIAYLGAVLKKNGVKVILRDGACYKDIEEFRCELKKFDPDILGLSLLSSILSRGIECAKLAKEIKPSIKIIAGGAHPTAMPVETLKIPQIDIVVFGEGELTLLELVKAIEKNIDLSNVKGIYYKVNDKIINTPKRSFIENLSDLPWPARENLNMEKYLRAPPVMTVEYPATYQIVSRGCFGNCFFCQPLLRKLTGRRIRTRAVKDVVDEIEHLISRYKIRGLILGCDEPLGNRKWVINFCDELIRREIKLKITAPCRVDIVDIPFLKKTERIWFCVSLLWRGIRLSEDTQYNAKGY